METVADRAKPTVIRTDLRAIFVSLELSRSRWLITSLSPGNRDKMSPAHTPTSSPPDRPGEVMEPVDSVLEDSIDCIASRNRGGACRKDNKEYDK